MSDLVKELRELSESPHDVAGGQELIRAAAERIEADAAELKKEREARDKAIAWANRSLDSVKERMWKYFDALKWIKANYANQDMSHKDFRVEAFERSISALKGDAE